MTTWPTDLASQTQRVTPMDVTIGQPVVVRATDSTGTSPWLIGAGVAAGVLLLLWPSAVKAYWRKALKVIPLP